MWSPPPSRPLRVLTSLAAVVAFGCSLVAGTACRPEPCISATCLADRAVGTWETDRAATTTSILGIEDEMTRTAVVGELCERFPGETQALCAALPPGSSRRRCERLNSRPHLSIVPGAPSAGASGQTGGVPMGGPGAGGGMPMPESGDPGEEVPGFPDVRLPMPTLDGPFEDPCAGSPEHSACVDHAALEAAIAGNAARADATCATLTERRWADECRFQAAEEAVQTRHAEAYPVAARLCSAADRFTQECWAHVLSKLPGSLPTGGGGQHRADEAADTAAVIAATWSAAGAEAAAAHESRFWALYFANAYRQDRSPDGTALDYYPPQAAPHIRAALTVRLHALQKLRGGLSAQVARVTQALARRTTPSAARGPLPDLVFVPILGMPTDPRTTFFLGAAHRPSAEDEATDIALCVVASAARTTPPDAALLQDAVRTGSPRVAAEATRLLDMLSRALPQPAPPPAGSEVPGGRTNSGAPAR